MRPLFIVCFAFLCISVHPLQGQSIPEPPPVRVDPLTPSAPTYHDDSLEPIVDDDVPEPIMVDDASSGTTGGQNRSLIGMPTNQPVFSTTLVPFEQTQVAVLGYHNFSTTKSPTDMLMRTSMFRMQMGYLKESGLPVISLEQFIAWKKGKTQLPRYCVLITIDDGWKSVYSDAYPILKEFNFPFTLFLYTTYLTGKGDSMSPGQIQTMVKNGASIGSHSTTHPYPQNWKRAKAKGEEAYKLFIDKEVVSSRQALQHLFTLPIPAYCYPGGYTTPEIIDSVNASGYQVAFTVIPGKVTYSSKDLRLPRYMVLGTMPKIFNKGVDFAEKNTEKNPQLDTPTISPDGNKGGAELPPPSYPVTPSANSTSTQLTPLISIQLSDVSSINIDSFVLMVSGIGVVPHKYDTETHTFYWQANRAFRTSSVTITARWKLVTGETVSTQWLFIPMNEGAVMTPKNHVQ